MITVTSDKGCVSLEYDGISIHVLMADFGRIVFELAKALQEDGANNVPDRIKHITNVALQMLEKEGDRCKDPGIK